MGRVANTPNVNSLDAYSKDEWVDFLKQGAFRGLKINKVARHLGKSKSSVYEKATHKLELINAKGKTITLDMAKLVKKNERWTFSRLIHNIKITVSTDYAKNFDVRIMKLAEIIMEVPKNKNTQCLSDNQKFEKSLEDFVDDQIINFHSLSKIKSFLNDNSRNINESIGSKEIKANLRKLCKSIEKYKDPQTRALAFQLQCTANALVPDPNLVWEALPSELQKLIFLKSLTDQSLDQLLLVSHKVNQNASELKINFINEENTCLKSVGCITAKEAVNYVVDNCLTSANLSGFLDICDEDLEKLGECPNLKNLSISGKFSGSKFVEVLGKLSNLQSLFVRNSAISDDQVVEGFSKLPNLLRLEMRGLWKFSDDKLVEALGKVPNLQFLDFSGHLKVSGDKMVEALAKLPELQSLILTRCKLISGDHLIEALGKLPKLQHLDIRGCALISKDKRDEIILKFPEINLIYIQKMSGRIS